jgi:hypothetical protein
MYFTINTKTDGSVNKVKGGYISYTDSGLYSSYD